jgi:recombination DNA repair RAD52 pathway protein
MPITPAQLKALTGRLNPARVAQRAGTGSKKLSYLQAWDVRTALIRLFGFGGWSEENISTVVDSIERDVPKSGGGTTAFRVTVHCSVRLTIHQTGAVYTGVAASSQSGAVLGDVMDFAMKTADSDAFKRAAMNLGTQFGLSLYDNGSTNDVVKVVFSPDQLFGPALTEANIKQAQEAGAIVEEESSLTPEQKAEAEALVERAIAAANERDSARVPEDKQEVTAEAEAPAE